MPTPGTTRASPSAIWAGWRRRWPRSTGPWRWIRPCPPSTTGGRRCAGWVAAPRLCVDRALASAPNFAPALRNRALILWELGRTAEALAALKRALTLEPNDANDWANAAALLYLQDRCAEAVADAERALALRPDHAAAWATRGYALSRLGRAQDALASFDRALAASAEQAEVWLFRGETLLALQRPAEALASYDRALALDPASPDAFAGRGRALSTLGRHDDALIDCRQATQAAPERADFWINFSVALGIVQRLDEALVAIERALALEPSDPAAQLARGQLLCEMGRTQEGLAQIAQRARQLYGEGQASEPPQRAPEAKARHDEEQRAYLAVRGVKPGRFHIDGGDRTAGPAVNPANRDRVADQWAKSRPQMVVIDQLLTPPALEGLRRFCWGSTVWRRSYRQGYLGAMLEHGFACPLLAQIAEELRETFPTMVGDHPLLSTWGFKYDSRLGGIRLHADQAAVNVNFWITPQEANLNPDSGGMVIWDVAAPADWDISRYNSDDASVQTYLADAKAKSIRVPYRENRAVVFDSDLFHETDTIAFREGYQNRRINVTMLYGRRNFHNI
jgi:tetratricopeptide (TPR) repeat protein